MTLYLLAPADCANVFDFCLFLEIFSTYHFPAVSFWRALILHDDAGSDIIRFCND